MADKTKNIYLGKYKEVLDKIAKNTGQSASSLLRNAIEEYIIPVFKDRKERKL